MANKTVTGFQALVSWSLFLVVAFWAAQNVAEFIRMHNAESIILACLFVAGVSMYFIGPVAPKAARKKKARRQVKRSTRND